MIANHHEHQLDEHPEQSKTDSPAVLCDVAQLRALEFQWNLTLRESDEHHENHATYECDDVEHASDVALRDQAEHALRGPTRDGRERELSDRPAG